MARQIPRRIVCVLAAMLLSTAVACDDQVAGSEPADREFNDFLLVYPTLIRDCGFHTCHGSEERFFRVWGAGRARLDPETLALDGSTGVEVAVTYDSALSMLDARDPALSPLLRKPLTIAAGGAAHGGVDGFGRDVYRTANDEGYLAIARFVFARVEEEVDAGD